LSETGRIDLPGPRQQRWRQRYGGCQSSRGKTGNGAQLRLDKRGKKEVYSSDRRTKYENYIFSHQEFYL
jgi:hypothetical protein